MASTGDASDTGDAGTAPCEPVVPGKGEERGGGPRLPDSAEGWRAYLADYSAELLRLLDELDLADATEEQRACGWLGYGGAAEGALASLEGRLGARLPPSYRSFLAASDGWGAISPFMWRMRPARSVDWLEGPEAGGVLKPQFVYEDGVLQGRALLVSGAGDAQYWLLDSGDVAPDGEWAAYIWASWYPGLGDRHRSFAELVAAERAGLHRLGRGE
ncbi:SMI1/KNR4 family protein [Streptomonospora wellingtoniae]|uniref:SMI1/KNR4 family protein n=1 Tax=Streptomonospora wellingtoniae TaxID=3075544 RepID=A0ABU2KQ09_9ACTN|nr:SMI1/KNR4 family protein [Streptomonospora sp. DSM 45055]MDT0301375.1 SMI1/KNR4 family protein [Streptomonospora sp. DSM 45055]